MMSQQIGKVVSKQAVDTLVDELARAISDERCFMSRGRDTSTIMQDILDLPPVEVLQEIRQEIEECPCMDCGWGPSISKRLIIRIIDKHIKAESEEV